MRRGVRAVIVAKKPAKAGWSEGRQEDECVRTDKTEVQKTTVPETAEQPSEAHARWAWAEPSVWTNRMLDALDHGIRGDKETKWFCLNDKVFSPANLLSAYRKVARNGGAAGVDHLDAKRFAKDLENRLDRIGLQLQAGEYYPNAVRRTHIPKPGSKETRPLGIPTVRDRAVQTAVRHVIEPIFEKEFTDGSYGFRPGRGCKDALREVDRLLKEGYTHVVDADLRKCFDRIPHGLLMERVSERVTDRKVLDLIVRFLKHKIMEDGLEREPEDAGTPQGATLSPLLCNVYLNPLDHLMEEADVKMVRYADDLVLVCRTSAEADHALKLLSEWVEVNGLELHPEKTRTVDMEPPGSHFDFLGYRFCRTRQGKLRRVVPEQSAKRLRAKLRPVTRRTNGRSMEQIIQRCNRILKGWYEYFKHARPGALQLLDGWVRMRLRSILRGYHKRKGRGRGLDHQRWPNQYFEELGLFSMYTAWVEESSPQRG
jgi:RNA-directed DNA polymerase